MDPNQIEERLNRLEKKMMYLMAISAIQLVLIVVLVVINFIPNNSTLLLILVAFILFAVLFHKQIPGWFGRLSRWGYSQILSAQKPDSIKDLK